MSKPDTLWQLKIKTSSIKRMMKDLEMYEKEEEEFKVKIDQMKNEGKGLHDIQQQEKCLHETLVVYRDVLKRLSSSYSDLLKHLKDNFQENMIQICGSNEDQQDLEDEKVKLISSALFEMRKASNEYGDKIKFEKLSFGNENKSELNETEFV
ncbi:Tubulin binding cofactor A family protein [Cryptosporidium felis]|nr:Tubulin binding cofactor A family protein [Cryptosporidium felis]